MDLRKKLARLGASLPLPVSEEARARAVAVVEDGLAVVEVVATSEDRERQARIAHLRRMIEDLGARRPARGASSPPRCEAGASPWTEEPGALVRTALEPSPQGAQGLTVEVGAPPRGVSPGVGASEAACSAPELAVVVAPAAGRSGLAVTASGEGAPWAKWLREAPDATRAAAGKTTADAVPVAPWLARANLRAGAAPAAHDAGVSVLRGGAWVDHQPSPSPSRALPGARVETPAGPLRLVEVTLDAAHCHGHVAVARALRAQASALATLAFDPALAEVDLSRALFLDTETTGLSGGTGTIPFLIGVAAFEDGALVVRQLLLEQLGEEAPMLEWLRERVAAASCLVTYNGKSYDWPLLSTRFVLNRVQPPPARPHLDLLGVARRLYRPRLGAVPLVRMEEEVLGFRRERDVDGAEIPGLYWSFLRHEDGAALAPIIEHNASDLIALAALLAVFAERFTDLERRDDPLDHLALAKVAARAKDRARAQIFAEAAFEGGGGLEVTVRAAQLLAELHGRGGRYQAAEVVLADAAAAARAHPRLAAPLHLALSKLYEHRLKDPARALEAAKKAGAAEGEEALARRMARLQRKVARRGGSVHQVQVAAPHGSAAAQALLAEGLQGAGRLLGGHLQAPMLLEGAFGFGGLPEEVAGGGEEHQAVGAASLGAGDGSVGAGKSGIEVGGEGATFRQ